jgi:hypothetical protein
MLRSSRGTAHEYVHERTSQQAVAIIAPRHAATHAAIEAGRIAL